MMGMVTKNFLCTNTNGTEGLYGSSSLSFLRNFHPDFHSDCTNMIFCYLCNIKWRLNFIFFARNRFRYLIHFLNQNILVKMGVINIKKYRTGQKEK